MSKHHRQRKSKNWAITNYIKERIVTSHAHTTAFWGLPLRERSDDPKNVCSRKRADNDHYDGMAIWQVARTKRIERFLAPIFQNYLPFICPSWMARDWWKWEEIHKIHWSVGSAGRWSCTPCHSSFSQGRLRQGTQSAIKSQKTTQTTYGKLMLFMRLTACQNLGSNDINSVF